MKFGRYEVQERIGQGGMASVLRAYDPVFEREVAIKVLPPLLLDSATSRKRFEREARAIAQLEHSAIVPVYDFGEENGQPYLVMRYMRGGSLHDATAYSPLSLQETVNVLTRIAAALTAAHQRGLIHRDIKPSNILFDEHGEAYLADFGIAKWLEGQTQLTGNRPIGTPAYMSPEQIESQGNITPRSDVYALTTVLFQMLTGEPPYREETTTQLLMAHLNAPVPDPYPLAPSLPAGLGDVIARGMAKSADDRFPTPTTLADTVRRIVEKSQPKTLDVQSRPAIDTEPALMSTKQNTKPSPRRAWLIGLGLFLITAVGVLLLWQRSQQPITRTAPSDGMVQQFIAAGPFETGVTDDQIAALCDAWAVWVMLTEGEGTCASEFFQDPIPQQTMETSAFWIDQTEVSNARYRHCVEAGFCYEPYVLTRYDDPAYADHPVIGVNWEQANDYCEWVGRDLPTGIQWRKAAYGDTQTLFAWGNEYDCDQGNLPGCVGDTVAVGSYNVKPYDMSGNVMEWLRDEITEDVLTTWGFSSAGDLNISDFRLLTGGSYASSFNMNVPHMEYAAWGSNFDTVGFRCVDD